MKGTVAASLGPCGVASMARVNATGDENKEAVTYAILYLVSNVIPNNGDLSSAVARSPCLTPVIAYCREHAERPAPQNEVTWFLAKW